MLRTIGFHITDGKTDLFVGDAPKLEPKHRLRCWCILLQFMCMRLDILIEASWEEGKPVMATWDDGPYPGTWMVRIRRDGPMVPARIFWCDHEPDLEWNKVDQPYLQGQIGLSLWPPHEIWEMLEFCESSPEEQRLLANPPPSNRTPRGMREPGTLYAPMAKWKQDRARRITPEEHAYQLADLAWAKEHAPDEPKVNPNRRIDPMQAALPF